MNPLQKLNKHIKMHNSRLELVFIPAPAMGHLRSTVELTKLIIQKNKHICISIYIIDLPIQSPKINAYVTAQSRDNPDPARLKFFILAPPSNALKQLSPNFVTTYINPYKPIIKQLIENRISAGLSKPIGLVLDMLCSEMVEVANEVNIPSYIFFTSGFNLLNLMFLAQNLADDHGIDVATKFSKPNLLLTVPGFKNKITSKVIPSIVQDREGGCAMFINFARRFKMCKGILVNSFVEFESFCVDPLLENRDDKIPRVYPVGPILVLDDQSQDRGAHERESDVGSIMEWLDSQMSHSVVFVCFGSLGYFDAEQVKEIADGLYKSGYPFIWALRKPPRYGKSSENEVFMEALPTGFLDRVGNRGKIIGWAPQTRNLAHPAIGGFVSHCGWNSILESMWFGVPIATWPLSSEQQLNAFEIVKELGLAVEIRMDYRKDFNNKLKGNVLVTADEVEKGINKLMEMDEEMRGRVKEMSEKGSNAIRGGSSDKWLERFIEDVFVNCC